MLITVCIKEFNLRIFYSRGNIFINYHIIHPPSLKEHSAAYYSADNVTPAKPSECPPHLKVTGEENQMGGNHTSSKCSMFKV